jgi:hypothetical protein
MRRAPLLLAALLLAAPASAQVYKWVDKDGKVHYSDKAPKNANAKDMGIASKPTDAAAVDADLEALKARGQAVDEDMAARQKVAQDDAAAKAERERQCLNAKADLNVLERVNRVVTVGADGKETYATDAQAEARRAQARQKVADLCG